MRVLIILRFLTLLSVLHSIELQAQVHRKKIGYSKGLPQDDFSKTQFYIGLRGGISFTKANVINRYSSFVSINNPDENYEKSYSNYKKLGAFVGMEFDFYFKGFTASFQPNYRREIYSYSNTYPTFWRCNTIKIRA